MISLEDKLAIYNSKNRRFSTLKEVVESLDLSSGEKGDTGERGEQGVQGLKGDKGDKGDVGSVGGDGADGVQGIQGIQGIKGDKGDTGEKGETGLQGLQGLQGIQGVVGAQGLQGVQGLKGDTGATGAGVAYNKGTVAVTTALSTRGGGLTSSNVQKQGIFIKLELSFSNGNTYTQAAGTRVTVAVLPTGFRPTQTVHTFASDELSYYPRHTILIESNGNVIWIPQNDTWDVTMNFQVVF